MNFNKDYGDIGVMYHEAVMKLAAIRHSLQNNLLDNYLLSQEKEAMGQFSQAS